MGKNIVKELICVLCKIYGLDVLDIIDKCDISEKDKKMLIEMM